MSRQNDESKWFLEPNQDIISLGTASNYQKLNYYEDYAHFNMVKDEVTYYQWLELEKNYFMNRYQRHPLSLSVTYKTMSFLGAGAYGEVWLVTREDGKRFAVKAIHQSKWIGSKDSNLKYIVPERKNLSSVHHPFIQELVDRAIDSQCVYFILPLVECGDLQCLVSGKNRRLQYDLVRFYVAQIVLAFEYMHKIGMVYRDLKLSNIALMNTGYIQILDLGFAKVLNTVTRRTQTFVGTPGFIAPEIGQNTLGYSFSVDWWTLGVLTFQMLDGCMPFEYDKQTYCTILTLSDTSNNSSEVAIPFRGDWNKDAKDLIRGLCRKSPAMRYGCDAEKATRIKRHRFFASIDFVALFNRRARVPLVPPRKRSLANAKRNAQFNHSMRTLFQNF